MSKRKHGKELHKSPMAASTPKATHTIREKTKPTPKSQARFSTTRLMAAIIFLLSFFLYFQTSQYGFTLDDRLAVFENTVTTQGIKAIPQIFSHAYLYGSVVPDNVLYRPVSKAIYAICWSAAGDKPMLYHLVNIFLFAISGLLLFLVLNKYLPGKPFLSFMVSALYVAHPIHTEVVCSIKSLDEILSLLFFLVSLLFIHAYLQSNRLFYLAVAALVFFFSFLSKESGITFLVIFPLILYFTHTDKKQTIKISGTMLVMVILVFGIRAMVLTGNSTNTIMPSDNIMAGTDNFLIQRATAIYFLGKYVLLLFFPHPLVCDYSPQQVALVQPGNVYFILSLLFLSSCLLFAVWSLRKKDWLSFAILFFFITISVTCNIFFLGGSHFAERFLYTPSLGYCLAVGVLLDRYVESNAKSGTTLSSVFLARPVLSGILVLIILAYGLKTIRQNPVWKDNIALFENGIKYSPKSYRMHLSLAQDLSDKKYVEKFPPDIQAKLYERAIREIKTSLGYFQDIDAYDMMGNIFYVTQRYDSALYYYKKGLEVIPDYENLNFHVGKALDKLKRYDDAIPYLDKALAKNPKDDGVLYNLALSYTNKNDINKGLEYFLKVIELRPNGPDAYYYTGLIYKAKGDTAKAASYLQKANDLGGPRE